MRLAHLLNQVSRNVPKWNSTGDSRHQNKNYPGLGGKRVYFTDSRHLFNNSRVPILPYIHTCGAVVRTVTL